MFSTDSTKLRKQITGLLTTRSAITCLTILFFQQVIESSATLWLVWFMKSIVEGSAYIPYIVLYLTTLVFQYIPSCVAFIFKTEWKQEAQRSFINAFVSANRNNIGEWNNKTLREEKLSLLSAEGPAALHSLIDYVWDLFTWVLSVFLNIVFLAVVVEPLFILAYSLSVVLVVIMMKLQRRTQRKLTQKALTARVDLCQSLLSAWDNVLLGNNYNFKLWDEKTTQRLNRCLQRNIDLERFDQILAIFAALVTSIPSLLVVVYFVFQYQADPVQLSSFVVILPILFMILTYTYQTISLGFRWGLHKAKLMSIYKAIQASKDSHHILVRKVKWDKIMATLAKQVNSEDTPEAQVSLVNPRFIESHADLLSQTATRGRLTLRGENGSGKSTALMLIKNALAGRAFFLPTHDHLSFFSETNKFSTGESLRKRLFEILEKVDVDVLLLDEWDANLDKENQESLSELIDKIAEKKCVIEVRHR
jgi:ABC-type transport system involved in cytochrome bd biosynthesis fused ATPase/permease subunit